MLHCRFSEKTCFRIYCNEALNLEASKDKCKADGGTLAVIENAEQNEFIRQMKAQCGLDWVLIGILNPHNLHDALKAQNSTH